MNILRRLPLARLLLLCALVVATGAFATAIAVALDTGPTPPPKPLPDAVHDALAAAPVQGVSANVKLTDHLLEGANLAAGQGGEAGALSASPLLSGASGRLWAARDGRVRLELQAEKGDTQILYDGHTLTMYDAATNTLYRSQASGGAASEPNVPPASHEAPSVAKIEEAISHLSQHADISGAAPTDVAGHPAYTVRVSPKETGSLLGGAELSFDADSGVPLRAALYSSTSSAPALELAATEISYGAVEDSVFQFTPPANAKIDEIRLGHEDRSGATGPSNGGESPKVTPHGQGLSTILVVEHKTKPGEQAGKLPEGLPQVKINGVSATELSTELGTLLGFERSGVQYLVGGLVSPAQVEALARGL